MKGSSGSHNHQLQQSYNTVENLLDKLEEGKECSWSSSKLKIIKIDSMCICLSHPIYSETTEPIVPKFEENLWFVNPFTYGV